MDQKTYEYMNKRVELYKGKEAKLKTLESFKYAFNSSENCYVTARIDGKSNSDSLTLLIGKEESKNLNALITDFISDLIKSTKEEMEAI
jgi:hypothetical protein